MIEVKELSFSYLEGENKVLDNVSFKLKEGIIYCLLGINGAGKTTLFNCLSGFLPCDVSSIHYTVSNSLLYIQDDMHFYQSLTGREFLNVIVSLKKQRVDNEWLVILIDQLKLSDKIDHLISSYSLGTKQKLILLIAFLLDYKYILMDEPFGSIDFISAEVVIDFFNKVKEENKTIIVSTHLMDIAHEVADEILFLHDGKIRTMKNDFSTVSALKQTIRNLLL